MNVYAHTHTTQNLHVLNPMVLYNWLENTFGKYSEILSKSEKKGQLVFLSRKSREKAVFAKTLNENCLYELRFPRPQKV